jgi:hypothetical protein
MVVRVARGVLLAVCLVNVLSAAQRCEAGERPEGGATVNADARVFYVDDQTGDDGHDGRAPDRAWKSLDAVNSAELKPGDIVRFRSGGVWRGALTPSSGAENAPVTYTSNGQGPKPRLLGSAPRNRAEDWVQVRENVWATLPVEYDPLSVDVGNIIFDDGAICGWKKWSLDELSKPYDYYYEPTSQRVYLYLETSPASRHRSIELALARHIVNQGGKHHVVYDGLALMYGAAHGFGGGNTHDLVIRNCDLGYIGGAHQFTNKDGWPVRFGNGIEFWGAAHDNLVESCRLWEIYDAALTNQGQGPDSKEVNITYQNNVIWNAEYSFEYWNNPETAVTQNIRFLHNTCLHAGRGWAHAQRPDPNGSHLMFYSNTAATSGIEVKYNIFYDCTDWGCRYSSGWKVLPEMDYNVWFSGTGVMAHWFNEKLATFDQYRQTTGLDTHSLFADPQLIDPAHGEGGMRPDSPARTLLPDGSVVGATLR